MKHDVTADPLTPEMRIWVDKAAEEVVAYVNEGGRLSTPDPGWRDTTCKPGQKLTDLERKVADLVARGWDDESICVTLDTLPQVVGRLKANVAMKHRDPDYSPLRRFDEAD